MGDGRKMVPRKHFQNPEKKRYILDPTLGLVEGRGWRLGEHEDGGHRALKWCWHGPCRESPSRVRVECPSRT